MCLLFTEPFLSAGQTCKNTKLNQAVLGIIEILFCCCGIKAGIDIVKFLLVSNKNSKFWYYDNFSSYQKAVKLFNKCYNFR